jgi:hypothetical protein
MVAHPALLEHAASSRGPRWLLDREHEAGYQPVGVVEGDRLAEVGIAEFFGQLFDAATSSRGRSSRRRGAVERVVGLLSS